MLSRFVCELVLCVCLSGGVVSRGDTPPGPVCTAFPRILRLYISAPVQQAFSLYNGGCIVSFTYTGFTFPLVPYFASTGYGRANVLFLIYIWRAISLPSTLDWVTGSLESLSPCYFDAVVAVLVVHYVYLSVAISPVSFMFGLIFCADRAISFILSV